MNFIGHLFERDQFILADLGSVSNLSLRLSRIVVVGVRWEGFGLFVSGLDLKVKSVVLVRRGSFLNAHFRTVTGCAST
jgi:hypothetical protein